MEDKKRAIREMDADRLSGGSLELYGNNCQVFGRRRGVRGYAFRTNAVP
jgi:hypothetical protein